MCAVRGVGPLIFFGAAFLYDAAISLPKFSILFFSYRIFQKKELLGLRLAWDSWCYERWVAHFDVDLDHLPVHNVEKVYSPFVEGHCFSQYKWFIATALSTGIWVC